MFTKEVNVPPYTLKQLKQWEFVTLDGEGPLGDYEYTWEIVEVSSWSLKAQVHFSNPY